MNVKEIKEKLRKSIKFNLNKIMDFDPYTRFGVDSKKKFSRLMKTDPAFSPFLLDNEKYVTARIGGNLITSIHRKLGDLYEDSFKILLHETLGISDEDLNFSVIIKIDGEDQKRSTDGLIQFDKLSESFKKHIFSLNDNYRKFIGVAFEVRSCYQIGDSKRIQADRDLAHALRTRNIYPSMLIFCITSLKHPVKRLAEFWDIYEGNKAFELVKNITDFDFFKFLNEEQKLIKECMDKIFNMI